MQKKNMCIVEYIHFKVLCDYIQYQKRLIFFVNWKLNLNGNMKCKCVYKCLGIDMQQVNQILLLVLLIKY